jgi:type I restriction enzyme S subunit
MRKDWTGTTLGEVADITMGQSPPGHTYNSAAVGLPFMQGSAEFGELNPKPVKWCSEPARVAKIGDILLSVRAPVGDTNIADQQLAIGRGLATVRAKEGSLTSFLRLALQCSTAELISVSGTGMFAAITGKSLRGFRVIIPPLGEQRRIVNLVSSVDSYIAALQQQADAARVARNAVLSELLSAGRDDWTETTLGDVAEYVNGYPFKPEHLGEVGTPVIRIRQLLDPTEPVDRTSIDVPDKCVLRDGDIVFSWSGTLAVRIWTRGEAFLNQHLFRILPGPKVDKALLPLLIEHAIEDLIEKSHGTTMKHITKQSLLPHEILLPPLQDQRRIVDLVSSIDDVVQSTERAVADAKSLRSGLLSAVLSGDHEIPESYDRLLGAA